MFTFTSVPELSTPFLQLFPHRFDFLYANHAQPGKRLEWHTESRYPLSDRMIQDGRKVYGVRFGAQTCYLMLDIDRGSPYHPQRDRRAVDRICQALERLGLVAHIRVTSSYSGGFHLYFPFPDAVPSWELASAAQWFLQQSGFWIEPGYLEIFPNVQNYDCKEGQFSRFNGHRLPLQAGSYLLSEDWQLDYTSHEQFVKRWQWAEARNEPDRKAIAWAHGKVRARRHRALSFKASKFLEDLNTCIEPGWSDFGQTNWILGRITLRAYCFGHVLKGDDTPLTGDRLIAEIVSTATKLPGYEDYCRHQVDIWRRAEEWARCAENSRYFPYGSGKQPKPAPKIDWQSEWNKFQQRLAVERICFAIADGLNREEWPATITERFNYLVAYGLSGETLYKHCDLWHPHHIGQFSTDGQCDSSALANGQGPDRAMGASGPDERTNLLSNEGVNPNNSKDLGAFWEVYLSDPGCNSLLGEGSSHFDPDLEDFSSE